ncbi:MAG: efflux RND transporter periplasmic adaptor subunit [Anaerolineales bacterium]|nr:MAG: efflux RND transporter periplasmic adaptor subunit [Anaerolineales bacterium]
MKRVITIILILGAVIGLSWLGYQAFGGQAIQKQAVEDEDLEKFVVKRDAVEATVSATGSIAPETEVTLTFELGGKVEEILVEKGQMVNAGDPLAKLEMASLELQVAQAQATLALNEAKLQQTMKKADAEDITAAEAELASAKANYEKVKAGPTEDELIVAKADMEKAAIAVQEAQAEYDRVAWRPGVSASPQAAALQQASIDYERAKANYQIVAQPSTESELKSAWAQVVQAQTQLDKLRKNPAPEDVAIAQAQVDQAQAQLEEAQLKLKKAVITAPFDGVVASLGAEVGEMLSSNTPMVVLVDISNFHIDVEIDEIDISQIAVGQEVLITLDALPDEEIAGHVEAIAPTASSADGGVVSYVVTVAIEPTDALLRPGMSANITITTARKDDALIVPNRYIQIDRESGKMYVERLEEDGLTSRLEIETGMRDELSSEVVAGLEEGDTLVLRSLSGRERLQRTFGPPQ